MPEAASTRSRLGVVLVAYDHAASIGPLLEALAAEKQPGDRIVLVDNHPDHACAGIAENEPAVDVVIRSENVGFGAGCNKGAAAIEDEVELLFFLNPDSSLEKGAITKLREGGKEEWAAWMGLLLLPSGKINSASNTIHVSGLSWCSGYGEDPSGDRSGEPEPVAVSGADMVVRSQAWKRLGGFAPGYFLYYEDTDLCFRLKQMGHHLGVVRGAHIVHDYEFEKSSQKWFFLERNRYVFIVRTWPLGLILALLPLLFFTEIGLWVASVFQGRFFIRIRAIASFLRALPRLLKERRRISRERTLTAYECFAMLEPGIDTPLLNRFVRSRPVTGFFVAYCKATGFVLKVASRSGKSPASTAL